MAKDLKPGDLCEVVKPPGLTDAEFATCQWRGMTVILARVCSCSQELPEFMPFWKVSGIGEVVCISHLCLRKIPPAPMDDEEEVSDGKAIAV